MVELLALSEVPGDVSKAESDELLKEIMKIDALAKASPRYFFRGSPLLYFIAVTAVQLILRFDHIVDLLNYTSLKVGLLLPPGSGEVERW